MAKKECAIEEYLRVELNEAVITDASTFGNSAIPSFAAKRPSLSRALFPIEL